VCDLNYIGRKIQLIEVILPFAFDIAFMIILGLRTYNIVRKDKSYTTIMSIVVYSSILRLYVPIETWYW